MINKEIKDIITDIYHIGKLNDKHNYKTLDIWRNNNKYANKIITDLSNKQLIEDKYNAINDQKATEVNKLIKSIEKKKKRKRYIKHIGITAVAAAIIAVSMNVYNRQDTNYNIMNSSHDVNEEIITEPIIKCSDNNVYSLMEFSDNNIININNEAIKNIINNNNTSDVNKIIIPHKYTMNLLLEDGTEVTINANSTLEYPTHFNENKREVTLQGEAFFDVAKSNKMFIVKTKHLDVNVYGTKFCVNDKKEHIEVVLESGEVGVNVYNNSSDYRIEPGELFSYNKNNQTTEVKKVEVSNYIGWLKDEFAYSDKNIEDVLFDISQWYNITFEYNKTELKDKITTLFSSRQSDVKNILTLIELASDIKFINKGGGRYTINKNK